jgi:hypothetical protein
MRLLGLIAVLGAAALAGCGDDSGTTTPTAPPEGEAVSYSRSGGIAGTPQSIEIEPDGTATVKVGFGETEQTEEFDVPVAELEGIVAGIEAVGMEELDQGIDEGCADCFLYELEFAGETASADSVTITDAYADATAPLQKLIDEHSAGAVKGG